MPLSDYMWNVQAPGGTGIKRRNSGDHCGQDILEQAVKRQCTTITSSGDAVMDDENHNEMFSMNLNQNLAQGQQQLTCTGFPPHGSSPRLMQYNNNTVQQVSGPLQCSNSAGSLGAEFTQAGPGPTRCPGPQDSVHQISHGLPVDQSHQEHQDMIMNMTDEVYSTSTLPTEEDMTSNSMESDYVPDPAQYTSTSSRYTCIDTPYSLPNSGHGL